MNSCMGGPGERALGDYAAGRLDGMAAWPIVEHLAECPACRDLLNGLEPTLGMPEGPSQEASRTVTATTAAPEAPEADDDDASTLDILRPSDDPKSLGRIGEYEVLSVLGRGSMGTVLKAFDASLHRFVAIKVLASWLAASERGRRRFLREARSAAAINHPNVVTIHAVSEQDGTPYIVMEYIAGVTLRQRLREGPPPEAADALRVGMQVADGLAAAHAQGVIHRDIKPANIMLEAGFGRVKITDFSLALAAMNLAEVTSVDHIVGTPAYMAPEQVNAPDLIDPRSDLFGLGCVLYAMLDGQSPFKGAHTLEVIRKVCDFDPPALRDSHPAVSPELSAVVAKLLQKDRKDRFQAATELANTLRAQLATLNQGRAIAGGSSADIAAFKPPGPRRRLPALAILAAMGALLLVLAAWTSRETAPEPRKLAPPVPSRVLTVSKRGDAKFTRLDRALEDAGPGSIVRITDGATYEGAITIDDPARLEGLTIEATAGATLAAPPGAVCVVRVAGTPGVALRGFQIKAGEGQHGLIAAGDVPGLTIDRVRIDQPSGVVQAALYLESGTGGTRSRPIVLRNLDLDVGGLGVGIFGTPARPASNIRLEDCRIKGHGVLVLLDGAVRDVAIVGNILRGGGNGLNFNLSPANGSGDILVANNTFCGNKTWVCVPEGLEQAGIAVHRNLILDVPEVQANDADLARVAPWFADNAWRAVAGMDRARASKVALVKDQIPIRSADPSSPDFLRPTGVVAPLPAVPGRERAGVGARSPELPARPRG